MKNNERRINVEWGGGVTDLFLDLIGKKPRVLDYEYDREKLHSMCGGKTYYVSRSGYTGKGWLENLDTLIPLGAYRVDTAHNDFQWFLPVGKTKEEEVLVAVPYRSHGDGRDEILQEYPTVVKVGNKVVYCDFYSNFTDILRIVFSGKKLPEKCEINGVTYGRHGHRTLRRIFTDADSWGIPREEEVVMEFYDLCSMDETSSPWEFYQKEMEDYKAEWSEERMFQLLSVERLKDGTFVRTTKIAGKQYRGRMLEGNPLETGNLTAGWHQLADDVLARFYDKSNEIHLLAYAPAKQAYEKLARRLANRMGEGEEFVSFVSTHEGEYVEYELVMPKVVCLLDEAGQMTELRKGLARKIRQDVADRARQWIEDVTDQAILEAVPDDLVVSFDDSLDAGNCRPGTESFVCEHFPGQTQTTAKELKKFSSNYSVMRIFRHLAAVGRFDYKAKSAVAV